MTQEQQETCKRRILLWYWQYPPSCCIRTLFFRTREYAARRFLRLLAQCVRAVRAPDELLPAYAARFGCAEGMLVQTLPDTRLRVLVGKEGIHHGKVWERNKKIPACRRGSQVA